MNWKKTLIIVFDVIIGCYLVLAMTAFNRPDEMAYVCNDISITIEQDQTEGFLNDQDIKLLLRHAGIQPLMQPMKKINTRQIEEILQGNDLIDNAECYKALDGTLSISIQQRVPVVRIMAENGEDYYVDNRGEIIPHNNYACHLIVATGHISKRYAAKVLAPVVAKLRNDRFWKNQVVQLNVLDDGSLELIPRVGNHIVYLGQPTGIEKKLDRLRKFYRYGLSKAGWNRYSRISVEFDNQIICKRHPRGRTVN